MPWQSVCALVGSKKVLALARLDPNVEEARVGGALAQGVGWVEWRARGLGWECHRAPCSSA
jgi:hypothetical protein